MCWEMLIQNIPIFLGEGIRIGLKGCIGVVQGAHEGRAARTDGTKSRRCFHSGLGEERVGFRSWGALGVICRPLGLGGSSADRAVGREFQRLC